MSGEEDTEKRGEEKGEVERKGENASRSVLKVHFKNKYENCFHIIFELWWLSQGILEISLKFPG